MLIISNTYLHEIPVLVETGEIFAQDSCDHCGSDAAVGGRVRHGKGLFMTVTCTADCAMEKELLEVA